MKRIILSLVILFLIFSSGFAAELKNPFVSELKGESEGNLVRLTWTDSDDPVSKYLVFRSSSIISNDNFQSALKLAELLPGTESFVDFPGDRGKYFYAILSVDSAGRVYRLFIPYKNITTSPLGVSDIINPEDIAAEITSLRTEVSENRIIISFKSSKTDRNLIIYRSPTPIQSRSDLVSASLIGNITSDSGSYTDYPVPGISYYYAVLDSDLAESGRYVLIAGQNSSVTGAIVATGVSSETVQMRETKRTQPLPYLQLESSIDTGSHIDSGEIDLPKKHNLSLSSAEAVSKILDGIPAVKDIIPEPVILDGDTDAVTDSDDFQLKRILLSDFTERNWTRAYELLSRMLQVRHSDELGRRIHFYLGQILYFQKEYKKSFMEFILVYDDFQKESQIWMDSILHILGSN